MFYTYSRPLQPIGNSNFGSEMRIRTARDMLDRVDKALSELEAQGQAGGLNPTHLNSTRVPFVQNQTKMAYHIAQLQLVKSQLSAHRSSQLQDSKILETLQTSLRFHEAQAYNLKGVLVRSMTTGVWIEPSKRFLAKLTQRKALVSELVSYGEQVKLQDLPEPLKFQDMLRGFHG